MTPEERHRRFNPYAARLLDSARVLIQNRRLEDARRNIAEAWIILLTREIA